ncbi:kinase-like protein [Trichoderma citrinoviride]|uniref:Kinase-like protein n=1 Tax=Trichoderma citrinoviride TaxID=58853 RepID=A0A2T4BKZ6_9HYPO|nr:kinase-like protein [Trichoderma citrinoviride]PTB69986.1 kinase-like protein [Trichoderma citrinoviride]
MSDNCLLLNKTNKEIYLVDTHLQTVRICLGERKGCVIRPGIWTISVDTGERDRFTENRLVEFLLLRRRFSVSIHGVMKQSADDRSAEDERGAKRQKLDGGRMKSRMVQIKDSSPKQSEHLSVAGSHQLLPAPREVVNRAVVPILDLTDGETALIRAPEVNLADTMGTYRLQRIEKMGNTGGAGVFSCQRSGIPEILVAKVLFCPDHRAMSDVRRVTDMWMQEKTMLEGLEHKNIVSLKGVDARFLAIYLEYLPSSLRRGPGSTPIGPSDARKILCDMSSALAYLSRRGIVHHDIKPQNITYSAERGAVLIDFGMAASVTDPDEQGGSPHFYPPEYVDEKLGTRGLPGDIWALGVTMLYILRKLSANFFRRDIYLRDLRDLGSRSWTAFQDLLQEIARVRKQLNVEDVVENLIFQMLEPNVKRRVSAADIEVALRRSHAPTEVDDDADGND